MINWRTEEIIKERKPEVVNVLRDVDGDGIGNSALVERMERPKEGGILVYLVGYKYPYKGLPHAETVKQLGNVKRMMRYAIEAVQQHKTWQLKVALGLFAILPERLTKGFLDILVDFLYLYIGWILKWELMNPKRYSRSVRELYRVFTKIAEQRKTTSEKRMVWLIRDVLCMIVEQDSAYRFRFQDIITEAKQAELRADKKRMIAELHRLIGVAIDREGVGGITDLYTEMKDKWVWMRRNLIFILKHVRVFSDLALDTFRELNFDEVIPDDGDRYFMMMKKDYHFFGKPLPERIEMRKQIEGKNWHYFQEVGEGFLKEWERDRNRLLNKEASK